MSTSNKPPKKSKADIGHSIAKAALSSIPGIGGAATELFQCLLAPPIETRRDKWFEEVCKRLDLLEKEEKIIISELFQNDEFIDALIATTKSTLATHKEEKRDQLLNALINVSLEKTDPKLNSVFIYLIDKFTAEHMVILGVLSAADSDPNRTNLDFYTVKDTPRKLIKDKLDVGNDLITFLVSDLTNNNLIRNMETWLDTVPPGDRSDYITSFGEQFMEFISSSTDD